MTPLFKTYADEVERVAANGEAECTADRQHYAAFLISVIHHAALECRDACMEIFGLVKAKAHRCETYCNEASRVLKEAQAPDSDGGKLITPAEAKKVERLVARGAGAAHEISEGRL